MSFAFNRQVAYTFDAGPNACLYLLENEVPKFLSFLNVLYPNDQTPSHEYIRGLPIPDLKTISDTVSQHTFEFISTLSTNTCVLFLTK